MRTRATALAACLVAALHGTGASAADGPGALPCTFQARDGRLRVSVDLGAAYPADLARQLGNGLTNVIALHLALVPENGDEVVALYGREIDILYDVWEETYQVRTNDVEGGRPRSNVQTFKDYRSLHDWLSGLRDVDLGPLSAVSSGSWVIQMRVEVNPISKELLDRTREFLANPSAGARVGGSSRSVLGVMASFLLRGTDSGAETHRFVSHPFTMRQVVAR